LTTNVVALPGGLFGSGEAGLGDSRARKPKLLVVKATGMGGTSTQNASHL